MIQEWQSKAEGVRTASEDEAGRPAGARRSRRLLLALLVLFLALIAFLTFIGVLGGNVRAIVPGRAYRSGTLTGLSYTGVTARLSGNDLDSVLKRDHIHTVICLRSGSPADDWYRQESADCARDQVVLENIPISARSLPPPSALRKLLDVFDHAKYPILMHCQAGADRTGLASTIFAHVYNQVPLNAAQGEELSWRYGHFPVAKTRAMDTFFDLYRRDGEGMTLRDWIYRRYPQIYAEQTASRAAAR